jgi:transcriptional regulator with XRE-family HTH domain
MLTTSMETLGDRIRSLRDKHDLSLRELARKLGDVTAAHISDIENGRRNPSPELLAKLARVLIIPVEELEKLGAGLPIDELRDAVRREPALGFALRKVAEQGISAEELLNFTRSRKRSADK